MTYSIFAVLGVQLWAGKLWKCVDVNGETLWEVGVNDCNPPNLWKNADANFDHIGKGLLSLFEVASLELWVDIMYSTMDIPSSMVGALL